MASVRIYQKKEARIDRLNVRQAEMFKIVGGQISRVEVVLGPRVPFGMRSPFDMKTLWETR